MEAVGKFEFNRKDLIGHGAFAVVFKGRHKEKRDWEVAVKCINKKNLSKSQSLLGKEIKILKELRHENIVRLLDYQEMGGCIYLIMEYCNGGDLAEYLQTKGALSEDTIRVFLQQIAKAMKVLQSKGILHRDLKPQNILLCHPEGRKSCSINTSIKIADFGFARHLQINTMAATLCGSPMYMAPEVIMSQNYDAKADLWSIGTIVYQCLTGKAPFHASSPQELRLFYESNETLLPRIPKETSANLRHLLMGLLQRNHKERMSFEEFFHHPFLESSSSTKKCSPSPVIYTNSGSSSSSSSSSTSQLASPQTGRQRLCRGFSGTPFASAGLSERHSDGELHQLQPKELRLPKQNTTGLQDKAKANQGCKSSPSCVEDYVMVPAELSSMTFEHTSEVEDGSPTEICLNNKGRPQLTRRGSGSLRRIPLPPSLLHFPPKPLGNPVTLNGRNCSPSVPIPVPTQIHNYHRMAQNLQPVKVAPLQCGWRRASCPGVVSNFPKLAKGGAQLEQSSPPAGMTPKTSEQTFPLSTKTGLLTGSPDAKVTASQKQPKRPNRTRTVPSPQCLDQSPGFHNNNISRNPANKKGPFKRSLSTGRLSDMLLKAAFGANLFEEGCDQGFNWENSNDTTAPSTGCYRVFQFSDSPPPAVFAMGSPSQGNSPPDALVSRMLSCSPKDFNSGWILNACPLQQGSRRNSETEAMDAIPQSSLIFHPPELPEDTLMEQAHTDALSDLRFTLAFVTCVMELASSKGLAMDDFCSSDISFLEQSFVTDQISVLSKEWSYAEQLVLYMKAEEFLSSALHTAKENIKLGQLQTSSSVKQVIRKLNNLYKNCVTYCRSLNDRLQTFLLDKQKLMDHFNSLTAEKLIYGHTVQMIQSAALDEMFHYGAASAQRYNKALLLMEGLSRILTEQKDIDSVEKCKKCIERRLSALQT